MVRVARLPPLTRIRRLVATLAARRVAAMMLARLEISDGDILVLSLGGQTTRSAETRMRLALRSQLDAARLYRASVVSVDEGATVHVVQRVDDAEAR